MEQVKIEKIAETFKDEEFAKRIIKIKEKEELINAFAEKGLELSTGEVNELIQKGKEAISSGEFSKIKKALSEDELENVSGGSASDFVEGLTAFPRAITYAIQNSPEDPAFAAGILISAAAVTALAAPTVYKGLKAAGKGIYKAGSKVYNKVTGSNKSNEIK